MGHITLTDGIAIWQLIYYIAALGGSIWVSARHGFSKSSGWIFLTIFSIIRVVGRSAQIATITIQLDAAWTIAIIAGFLGLSPLLLASLRIVSRVWYSILETPWNLLFSFGVVKVVQIPATVALILCIVGGASADKPAEIEDQTTTQAGCDRAKPGCTQCFRKQIPCLGYRNPSELRLRDETAVVAHKAQKAKKKKYAAAVSSFAVSTRSDALEDYEYHDQVDQTTAFLPPLDIFPEPLEIPAITYFMTSFIIASPFEAYLPGLYTSGPVAKDAVSSAVRAVSFATFALRVRDASYMKTARSHYALALAQTNASLVCPAEAILDRTLAAVLLLGLFEAIIFQGTQSPKSWTAHTLGALELLRLRGKHQFKSKLAHHLFIQTITNIRTSCVQRIVAVPSECLTLHQEAIPFLNPKDLALRLGPLIDGTACLRARATTSPSPELIYEAVHLDKVINALTDNLEEEMRYTVRPSQETPPWAYRRIAYSYPSHRVAKFWSAVRMIRMFLNELIWRGISLGFDNPHLEDKTDDAPCGPHCKCKHLERLQEIAAENMAEVATGVLASVPDFLEPNKGRGKFCPSARTLIWPLSILLTSKLYSPSARKYAAAFLQELARDLNMPQAANSVRMLGEPKVPEDW
ncbi:hypothetical protein QQZ08_011678 [Neonectria magnoliae]|uniref:DUF7702 domain-containing protein n=1 Tax=Neonectria magnoliae TaxID=2732573 RepID=A0ABR1H860_9HYPO